MTFVRGEIGSSTGPDKRLATIGATHVAYFGSLMQTDDIATTTSLRTVRRDLVVPLLADHGARLVAISGDTTIIEFATAESSVLYAVALQRAMMTRNASVGTNHRIWFLFGIHHGDVVFDGNDVYGDGVSIANEIANESDPGGVSISQAVFGRVAERLKLPFQTGDAIRLPGSGTSIDVLSLPTSYIAAQPDTAQSKKALLPRVRMAIREGTQLNDAYEIDRLIGSGGMGEIYRGHEIQTGDAVAIKLIRLDLEDNEAALALFQKEASALKHIYHEAVVRYYVFSLDQIVGRHFLAMEFVDGPSLSELIQDGPLPFDELTALRKRVAGGLQIAHERGIVHRDVTPDNIILPDGSAAHAKIIDFGIARSTNLGAATVIGGGFAGKYNYVSPEQLGLYGGDVTGKSDIYSFGLVLAAASSGRPLVMDGSHADTIDKRRTVPDLQHIDPRLRPLIAAMLQPDPNDRPASMGEVASWSHENAAALRDPPQRPQTKEVPPKADVDVAAAPRRKARAASTSKRKVERWIFGAAGLTSVLAIGGALFFHSIQPQPTPRPSDQDALLDPAKLSSPDTMPPQDPVVSPKTASTISHPDGPTKEQANSWASGTGATVASLGSKETQLRTFVRTFDGGPCFFANTTSAAANAASIEAFADSNAAFETFDQAITKAIGFEPDIVGNRVWSHQCPVVDFLRSTQRDGSRPKPSIVLKSTRLKVGQALAGDVAGAPGQSVFLLDIREDGTVENYTRLLKAKSGGQEFEMPLVSPEAGKGPFPHLVVVMSASGGQIDMPAGTIQADQFVQALEAKSNSVDVAVKMVLVGR